MKNKLKVSILFMVFILYTSFATPRTVKFETAANAGDTVTIIIGGIKTDLVYANNSDNVVFPVDNNDEDQDYDDGKATLTTRFFIAKTEVTNILWIKVYNWAITSKEKGGKGYYFANNGNQYNGSYPIGKTELNKPVIWINWRDAMIWCNALTEYYNENNGAEEDLECVYTYYDDIIRNSRFNEIGCDAVIANMNAKGFRLPTSIEWEYAARYRGSDATNSVAGYSSPYYIRGNSASGAAGDLNNAAATTLIAVYSDTQISAIMTKAPNQLGLYDMSGNAAEWCFDWHPSFAGMRRIIRGGSWLSGKSSLPVSYLNKALPNSRLQDTGFRFVRTK